MNLERVRKCADQLASAHRQVADATAERDTAIVAAFEAGLTISAIAGAAGLTSQRVGMILDHPHGKVGRPSRRQS